MTIRDKNEDQLAADNSQREAFNFMRDEETQGYMSQMKPENPNVSWEDMAMREQNARITDSENQNALTFDGYINLSNKAKQAQAFQAQQNRIAGAAMLKSAYDNGGLSDRAMSQSMSEVFGRPIAGMQILSNLEGDEASLNGNAVLLGYVKGANGETTVQPIAMMNKLQQAKMLQDANIREKGIDLRGKLYSDLTKNYTEKQLRSYGLNNPDGVQYAGKGTTISGSAWNALRGVPRQHSSISAFGANGKGGFTNYVSDASTGYQLDATDSGTRSEGYKGEWNVLRNGFIPQGADGNGLATGAYGTVYENSKTGATRFVKEGEDVNESDDIRKNRLKNQQDAEFRNKELENKKDIARMDAESRIAAAEINNSSNGVKYEPKLIADLQADIDSMKYERDEYGEIDRTKPRKLTDDERADIDAREEHLRNIKWGMVGYNNRNNGEKINAPSNEQGDGTQKQTDPVKPVDDRQKTLTTLKDLVAKERARRAKENQPVNKSEAKKTETKKTTSPKPSVKKQEEKKPEAKKTETKKTTRPYALSTPYAGESWTEEDEIRERQRQKDSTENSVNALEQMNERIRKSGSIASGRY